MDDRSGAARSVRDKDHDCEPNSIRRHLRYLSLTGLLGVTAFNTLVYQAGHTTEALNLALVAVCSPIVIVVLAWLLAHEHVSGSTVLGLGLAAGGVLLLITNGRLDRLANLDFAVGDLLMLIATVLFGSYTVLVRRKPDEIPITAFVFSTFVLGLLMLLPAYLVEFSTTGPFTTDARTVGALIYIGVFPSLLAFYAWNRAVTTIGATAPAVIYYLVPIFTGLAAWLLLDEPIGGAELLSIVLVIAGVGVGQRAIYSTFQRVASSCSALPLVLVEPSSDVRKFCPDHLHDLGRSIGRRSPHNARPMTTRLRSTRAPRCFGSLRSAATAHPRAVPEAGH